MQSHSPTTDKESARLLIVEDDPEMGPGLEDFFSIKGYSVSRATDGETAIQEITSLPPYDIVLLDVMLPDTDGFEVLREARKSGVDSPVIILTARSQDRDKLRGFELGADDYVTKPFNADELAARVQAVLRRSRTGAEEAGKQDDGDTYSFGDVTIDFSERSGRKNGSSLEFTSLEFDILEYLIDHRGRTVSRKQLLRDVWGISGDITTRTIDRHVASLRKKVEPDPSEPTYIETVYGIGYKFVG